MKKLTIFHASWCGPCKAYHPIVEDFKKDHPDVEVKYVDVDSDNEDDKYLMTLHSIRSVPTTIIESNGLATKKYGIITKDELSKLIEQ